MNTNKLLLIILTNCIYCCFVLPSWTSSHVICLQLPLKFSVIANARAHKTRNSITPSILSLKPVLRLFLLTAEASLSLFLSLSSLSVALELFSGLGLEKRRFFSSPSGGSTSSSISLHLGVTFHPIRTFTVQN